MMVDLLAVSKCTDPIDTIILSRMTTLVHILPYTCTYIFLISLSHVRGVSEVHVHAYHLVVRKCLIGRLLLPAH